MISSSSLLDTRGHWRELGAFVVSCVFDRAGGHAAFALGDGTLRRVSRADPSAWRATKLHDGAILSLAADTAPEGFLTGGDDGALRRITHDDVTEIASFGGKWVDCAASFADPRHGLMACSAGRDVVLFDPDGRLLKTLPHPSTVTGIAIDAKGKRVAASHYNGCTIWFVNAKADTPRLLEWKGSHIGIAVHPMSEAVVTSMQDNALHGWWLADGRHMRMSGYASKSESISFSRSGKWLASSGADSVVLWPFFGGGPIGKSPVELAGGGAMCRQVAFQPRADMLAAGFADGSLLLIDVPSERILPVSGQGGGAISALAWSGDGAWLAYGTENGFAAVIDLSKR